MATYNSTCEYCSSSCETVELQGDFCGDAQINGPEECDDGNDNNIDECSNICVANVVCSFKSRPILIVIKHVINNNI